MDDDIEHSSRIAVVSNAVLDGDAPTSVIYDGSDYFIFANDIDVDEFIDLMNAYPETDFSDWIPRVKPVCLHCLIDMHPDVLEGLHHAQQHGVWSAADD